jgi:hypothetical protein
VSQRWWFFETSLATSVTLIALNTASPSLLISCMSRGNKTSKTPNNDDGPKTLIKKLAPRHKEVQKSVWDPRFSVVEESRDLKNIEIPVVGYPS